MAVSLARGCSGVEDRHGRVKRVYEKITVLLKVDGIPSERFRRIARTVEPRFERTNPFRAPLLGREPSRELS